MTAKQLNASGSVPQRFMTFLSNNLAWFLAALVAIVGATTLKPFLYPQNIKNIFLHSTIIATLGVGTCICLLTGFFDMAQEATLILTASVSAWLMADSPFASGWLVAPWIAILVALALGAGIGLLQGVCVTKLGMLPFITSLSLRIAILGIVLVVLQGGTLAPLPPVYRWFGGGYVGPVPVPVIFVALLYPAAHWVLVNTRIGRSFFAVGGNRQSARNAGISDNRTITLAFIISGVTGALAGWMTAGRLNAANYQMAANVTFEVIAAGVLGGVSMAGGRGNLLKSITGILLMSLLVNYLYLRHISAWYVDLARGFALFAATLLDSRMRRLLLAHLRVGKQ